MNALYLNGLGTGETGAPERAIFRYLNLWGIEVEHHHVNWFSDKPFEEIFDEATARTDQLLRTEGQLALLGSSASGSLAINIFRRLQHVDGLFAVNLCGRLRSGEYPMNSKWSLDAASGMHSAQQSYSFRDSVLYCQQDAIPSLKAENKKRIAVVKQLADFVVPRDTMDIPGVTTHKMLALGHGMGIGAGVVALPIILEKMKHQV